MKTVCLLRSLIALAISVSSAKALAQGDTIRIDHRVACASCRISLKKVATIGAVDDPVLLALNYILDSDSRGRFFAVSADRSQFVVFDRTGKFVTASGRKGSGPGEFRGRGLSHVRIASGDTIYAIDAARTVHVFSPDQRFVRSFTLPSQPLLAYALPDGRLVMSAGVGTPDGFGYPFHTVSNAGAPVASFGRESRNIPSLDASQTSQPVPFVLAGNKASILVGNRYQIQRWGIDGRNLGMIDVRGTPWLPREQAPLPPRGNLSPEAYSKLLKSLPPEPQVLVIGSDTTGLLWVTGVVPSRSSTTGASGAGSGTRAYVVEVLDIDRRQLLASQPMPVSVEFMPSGHAFSISTDSDGMVSFTVWRLSLKRN